MTRTIIKNQKTKDISSLGDGMLKIINNGAKRVEKTYVIY